MPAQSTARLGLRWQSEARHRFFTPQTVLPPHLLVAATNYWTKLVAATNTFPENCDSLSHMTTSESYMRWRGPGVRVRPGRAHPLRNWPVLQQIAPACTFLQLWAVGRRKRGPFIAANFTSCHVIAHTCRYLHIKKFSRMNTDSNRVLTQRRDDPEPQRAGTGFLHQGNKGNKDLPSLPSVRIRFGVVRDNPGYSALIRLIAGRRLPSVRANPG